MVEATVFPLMCGTNCPELRPLEDGVPHEHETVEERHERLFHERERYEPAECLRLAADAYRASRGLPAPQLDDQPAPFERAQQVAAWHDAQPVVPLLTADYVRVMKAYEDLVWQVAEQLQLVAGLGIRIEYVQEAEPYTTALEQAEDVAATRRIKIATISVWPTRYHPVLSNETGGEYDQFRAVHDLFGHVAIGSGFDRHGEFLSFLQHESMFTGQAKQAAGNELHGENSYLAVVGRVARHKAALLPEHWCEL